MNENETVQGTVGFSRNRDSVAVVHKISLHVECTRDSHNISLI